MQSQLQRRAETTTRDRHTECAPSAAQSGGLGVVVRAALVAVGDDREEAVVADLDAVDVEHALRGGDEAEVDRVVEIDLNPRSTQSQLSAAIEPVAGRLLTAYKAAKARHQAAKEAHDEAAEKEAKDEMDALLLFKRNITSFLRVYSFLSQLFDYGNTAVEKRAIFFKRLLPLLEFGREREGVDLTKVKLTHHKLLKQGKKSLPLSEGEVSKLRPITDVGEGELYDKQRAMLSEIIEKVNSLFEGDLTDDDKLVYVNNVIKTKLMESDTLTQQAVSNSKEQFANSPDLNAEILNAIMDALAAHTSMSKQALDSKKVQQGLKDILLGPAELYEALRAKAARGEDRPPA